MEQQPEIIAISKEIEIYVKIITWAFPVILTGIGVLAVRFFTLVRDVAVLQAELGANAESDRQREETFSKIYNHIDEINKTLKQLEIDVRVLAEKSQKSG